jgi:hypothetical protein
MPMHRIVAIAMDGTKANTANATDDSGPIFFAVNVLLPTPALES